MSEGLRRSRIRPVLLSALVATSLMLTACSDADTSGGTGDTGAAQGEPQSGGDLVIGVTSAADTLFPWRATQFQAVQLLGNVYGTLTELDQDLEVVPGLAESWDVSEDGRTVTFHLREGVTFADGSAMDSADVVYSLESILDESTAAVASSTLARVAEVTAPDESTVELSLTTPDSGLFANLATVNLAILSSEDTEDELNTTPNGTGPFTFESRVPNESVTLARNDDYWGEPALLDTVEFRVIPDESSIVSALQSGNVQMAVFDDPLVADTAAGADVTVTETPQLSYHVLQLNARRGPLTDVNARLAIQCAIDRQEVLDTAALGEGQITGPITSPAYLSDPDARPCPTQDLDQARDYLDAAGMSDGFTLDTIVSQGEYATSVNEAQNLKAQLQEVGIELQFTPLESGAYVDRWVAADFDAAVALNGGRPEPDGMYGRYFTSDGNLNPVAGYASPELDDLFARGLQATDESERKEIYDQVARHLEDNAAWIWLFTSNTYTVTANDLQGFVPMANGSLQYLRTAGFTG